MTAVDTVVRAELAATKNQIHQMTTALLMNVAALDVALRTVEEVLEGLSGESPSLEPDRAREAIRTLRDARGKILESRHHLRAR